MTTRKQQRRGPRIKSKGWALAQSRECSICHGGPEHKKYYRCHHVRAWTTLTGKRLGNVKTTLKICTDCLRASEAQRLVIFASVEVVKPHPEPTM